MNKTPTAKTEAGDELKASQIPPKRDWNVERTINGFWSISTIYKGYRRACKYAGYTKREAETQFHAHLLAITD